MLDQVCDSYFLYANPGHQVARCAALHNLDVTSQVIYKISIYKSTCAGRYFH